MKIFESSNIGHYIYIVFGLFVSYLFLSLWMEDIFALIVLVAYMLIMYFGGADLITQRNLKIEYNLPDSDLKRVSPMVSKLVKLAIKKGYEMPKKYRIAYVNDAYCCNAFAFKKNHIALSRDLLDSLDDARLEGVLAHELGHLYYGHPLLQRLVFSSNVVFVLMLIFFEMIASIISFLTLHASKSVALWLGGISSALLTMAYVVIQAVPSSASRSNEYKCDRFAFDLNCRDALISALQTLDANPKKPTLSEVILSTHPDTKTRIFKLRSL